VSVQHWPDHWGVCHYSRIPGKEAWTGSRNFSRPVDAERPWRIYDRQLRCCLGIQYVRRRWSHPNEEPTRYGLARWQAGILFVGMFLYLGYSIRVARQARFETSLSENPDGEPITFGRILKAIVTFCIATAIVVIGSRLLVCNGEEIALRMGVPKLVLGLTLFAVGTSLPELTISLIAVLKGHEALGIGNIIGSNVMNICWVLASCALIKPLPIAAQTVFLDLPVTLLLTVLLLILPWKLERISTKAGVILLLIYFTHLVTITVAGVMT